MSRIPTHVYRIAALSLAAAVAIGSASCITRHGFDATTTSFEVDVTSTVNCGLAGQPNCPHTDQSLELRVSIRALKADGTLDTDFQGTAVLSLVPSGIIVDASSIGSNRLGALVTLTDGEAHDVPIRLTRAFGEVEVLVEDYGYTKAAIVTDAACFDLYPQTGCFAVDDDDPELGTGAAGVGPVVRFDNPRIFDIEQTDRESVGDARGYPSPLFGFRPTVDAESRDLVSDLSDCVDASGLWRELMVVTATTVDGFYVTDVCNEDGSAFAHLFVYNFHTPEDLSRGDCLLSLTGTIQEFQGFTEMKNPFWTPDIDPADPMAPRCVDLLPAPVRLTAADIRDEVVMEGLEAGIVSIEGATLATEYRVCDLNGNGALGGDDEWDCSRACGDEITCVVKESYDGYFSWTVNKDGAEINVVTRGVIEFDPEENLGLRVARITGTLRHLDFGRPAWTIEPRDDDDFEL